MMLLIPITSHDHKLDAILLVLDRSNLARMKTGDPAEIKLGELGHDLVNPILLVCYEDDHNKLLKFTQSNDIRGLLKYLKMNTTKELANDTEDSLAGIPTFDELAIQAAQLHGETMAAIHRLGALNIASVLKPQSAALHFGPKVAAV